MLKINKGKLGELRVGRVDLRATEHSN